MKLSVIIASRDMEAKVDQCLGSVFAPGVDRSLFEVVVCDSSSDGSMEKYKAWIEKEPGLRVVRSRRPLPPGPARNVAFDQSSGEYVLCLDVDDRLASPDALRRLLDALDGKDAYFCSYVSRKVQKAVRLAPEGFYQAAKCPVAPWTKVVRREKFVKFPSYTPEDVLPHFLLVDGLETFGHLDFPLVDYDDTPENKGAWSRTFDWLVDRPTNLLELARTDALKKAGLREEYVAGVMRNLADMWEKRGLVKRPEVKKAYMERLGREYQNFMSGIYVH